MEKKNTCREFPDKWWKQNKEQENLWKKNDKNWKTNVRRKKKKEIKRKIWKYINTK